MIENNNSGLDEKLTRFSEIESKIYDKYINKMSSKVNKLLDEKIPANCGLIHIKNKNVLARIDLLTGNPTVINYFETDNEYLWEYIVNVKFFNKPKVISIKQSPFMGFVNYELLSLGDAFYKEIDDLWNDKFLIKLGNELENLREVKRQFENWDKLGFCDGLNGEINETISTLYEYHE